MPLESICIFCASAFGNDPAFLSAANQTGTLLAQRNIALIYGGAKVGLMGAVADSALNAGGQVLGVIPVILVDLEVAHNGCSQLHVVKSMHERKALMGEKADAFLILPGGFGTFEELFEVLAWQSLKIHNKPVCLLNINGFYDGMLSFLDHCVQQGVLKQKARDRVLVASTPEEALALLEQASAR
ncbi:MAG: TIGR00730 family Rossman fold protein [Acidobacteria bacterium]|nr:TIGR00730 family Rossman fold protein [Acidobacteriota bacterium]